MTVVTYLDSLSRDLQNFNSSEAVVLKYADSFFVCLFVCLLCVEVK